MTDRNFSTEAKLSEILTSLKYIQKNIDEDKVFKKEITARAAALETGFALNNQAIADVSNKIDRYSKDRIYCKSDCDEAVRQIGKIAQTNRIMIHKNITFVKWSSGLIALLVPALIALAQIFMNPKTVTVMPSSGSTTPHSQRP